MTKLLKLGLILIIFACASKSLTPYMDEYKELKSEYESGLPQCQAYFTAMKSLFTPAASKEGPNDMTLTEDKTKIFAFISNNLYPAEVVQNGHNYNSYIFKPFVQKSDEFEDIYEDYTSKDSFGEGSTCEESQTILDFYSALIPTLKEDFKRLTEREAFIFSIKNYINAKAFMRNEPLNSAIVDIKVLDVLTKHNFTKIKPATISDIISYAEEQQKKLQSEYQTSLSDPIGSLQKLIDEEDNDDDIKNLNKAHRKEILLARKIRKKINKLMKKF